MSRTLIYAHRGANREAAENTRSAFERALQYPIDGIETDVQLSRDGIAVLWHDRFLGKAGLPDKHIDDFDLKELQAMNFAAHVAPDEHESLMTLQAFLNAYRDRCNLLIEIKNRVWESRARQELKVRQTLAMTGNDKKIMVSSFNLDSLVYAHQHSPDMALIYNIEPEQTTADVQRVLTEKTFLYGLCLPVVTLNDAVVRLLREHEKCIAVYTCNSDEQINLALALGVDILISDVPQQALQMRGECEERNGSARPDG